VAAARQEQGRSERGAAREGGQEPVVAECIETRRSGILREGMLRLLSPASGADSTFVLARKSALRALNPVYITGKGIPMVCFSSGTKRGLYSLLV
jgi:hypothetical protein